VSDSEQTPETVTVRAADDADVGYAEVAAALIDEAASDHDVARRDVAFLRDKLRTGRAAVALASDELVGFGYFSEWEGGRFVSHSGLVVRSPYRGRGLGRQLKRVLFDASRRMFPKAALMSLTTSEEVKALNRSLGYKVVPLERLTTDPAFWEGCETCRSVAEARARGDRCCCEGMLLE
jgi:GNAT superfamily N-acetyltransferase